MPIKVFIVEDNENLRQALKSLISLSDDIICTGDFDRCFMANIKELPQLPDVILMDIDLPGDNGIECTRKIKDNYPFINIIMLTVVEHEDKILASISAGATGYLIKSAGPGTILESIRIVHKGGSPLTPSIARKIFKQIQKPAKSSAIVFNKRESEILIGLVDGLTYKMIGEKHFISVDTVRSYIRSIYEKMEVHSRSEAIVKAIPQKLI
jgi:DNA-binding NarL/FixJ family response regulator